MRRIALWASFFVMSLPLMAGLVDHGDEFGFPNVNVDAHLKIIARHHFPDVIPELTEHSDYNWGPAWKKAIHEAVTGLNISEDRLKPFIEYVTAPEDNDAVPLPHEKLKEFDLYAKGRKSLFIEGKVWKEYPPAWKQLLELPLEQRRYTTIPVLYYFHRYTSFRASTYIKDILPQITAARKQGCRDTYGCEYDLCRVSYDLLAHSEIDWERKLDYYHAMIRDYALRWEVDKSFRYANWDDAWCHAEGRGDKFYSGEEMPGLRFNIYLETEKNLRKLCQTSDAMRDFIVAIGLTNRDMTTARKVALDFVESSPLNTPVLALRLPFEDAEQLLAGKPEYAQLLALLRIKQLSGMEKVKAIDAYLAKFPDYTPDDMPVTSLALNTHKELNAMAGLALLKEGQPVAALERWLKGGTPEDIGLIAEQIFTTDELLAFCRKHLPALNGVEYDIDSDQCSRNDKRQYPYFISLEKQTYLLRNLLARRLMRDKRQSEARGWFTGGETRFFSELFFHLTELKDNPQTPPENRLSAQLTLAALILQKGDILFGTFLEPDNLICHGQYPCTWGGDLIPQKNKYVEDDMTNPAPNAIADKIKKPDLPRFHYRWIAAEQFREAAKMTDDPRIKGFCFWKAGSILKYRDLSLANDDFRALFAIMPELAKNNWFKPAANVPNDIKAMDKRLSFFKSPETLLSWKCPLPTETKGILPVNNGTPEALIKIGEDLLGKYTVEDDEAALRAFHIAGEKGLAEGYAKCGEYYSAHQSYGTAIAYLKKALEMNRNSNLAKLELGRSLLQIGMWSEGLSLVKFVADNEKNDKALLSTASETMYSAHQHRLYGLSADSEKMESYRKNILKTELDDEE